LIKSYLTSRFDRSTDTHTHAVFFSSIVKPIINLSWNQKELPSILTVIENTFESIHCVISANPSALAHIEWFKNDQLIRGTNSSATYSHAFYICAHVHAHVLFSLNGIVNVSMTAIQLLHSRRASRTIENEFYTLGRYTEVNLSSEKHHRTVGSKCERGHSL
jgi:hypothetical protein